MVAGKEVPGRHHGVVNQVIVIDISVKPFSVEIGSYTLRHFF
jgi:hypothetical protein